MSAVIFDVDGIALGTFAGPASSPGETLEDRRMYQITDSAGRYVQLTPWQMKTFIECCAERGVAGVAVRTR